MDEEVTKVIKVCLVIILLGFGVKMLLSYEPGVYYGDGYTIEFPEDWEEWVDPNAVKKKRFQLPKKPPPKPEQDEDAPPVMPDPKVITYVTKERDVLTFAHRASITIFSLKLPSAAWIEDEFPKFIAAIAAAGNKIIDRGRVPISEEDASWVFYHNTVHGILNMEFYIITEGNMFYKIQFSSMEKYFNTLRPAFEKSKATFTVKHGLF